MKHFWKLLTRRFTPAEVAAKELADSELCLLEAKSGHEFAGSVIGYHESKIKRLRKFLSELEVSK